MNVFAQTQPFTRLRAQQGRSHLGFERGWDSPEWSPEEPLGGFVGRSLFFEVGSEGMRDEINDWRSLIWKRSGPRPDWRHVHLPTRHFLIDCAKYVWCSFSTWHDPPQLRTLLVGGLEAASHPSVLQWWRALTTQPRLFSLQEPPKGQAGWAADLAGTKKFHGCATGWWQWHGWRCFASCLVCCFLF